MSDEISHAEAAAYVPSSEPSNEPAKDYSADVVKDIAEKAWDVIQRSADIDVDDYVEEQKDRAADEKGEELPQNRKRERRERFARALEAAREAEATPRPDKRDALERERDQDARFKAREFEQTNGGSDRISGRNGH